MSQRTVMKISCATLLLMCAAMPARADSAMDACIDAFVAEHVPKDRTVKIRKLGTSQAIKGEERILLTAKGARSGTSIAAAKCVVSSDGENVALYDERTTIAANTQ